MAFDEQHAKGPLIEGRTEAEWCREACRIGAYDCVGPDGKHIRTFTGERTPEKVAATIAGLKEQAERYDRTAGVTVVPPSPAMDPQRERELAVAIAQECGAFRFTWKMAQDPPSYIRFTDAQLAAFVARIRNAGVAACQAPSRNWWCPTCQGEVPPERVTYEETHDPRAGGCGSRVLDRAPGVMVPVTPHPLLSSPTLYERTGDVKDVNTMLVNRGELRAALGVKEVSAPQPPSAWRVPGHRCPECGEMYPEHHPNCCPGIPGSHHG